MPSAEGFEASYATFMGYESCFDDGWLNNYIGGSTTWRGKIARHCSDCQACHNSLISLLYPGLECEEMLFAHLSANLESYQTEDLELHVWSCASCKTVLTAAKGVIKSLDHFQQELPVWQSNNMAGDWVDDPVCREVLAIQDDDLDRNRDGRRKEDLFPPEQLKNLSIYGEFLAKYLAHHCPVEVRDKEAVGCACSHSKRFSICENCLTHAVNYVWENLDLDEDNKLFWEVIGLLNEFDGAGKVNRHFEIGRTLGTIEGISDRLRWQEIALGRRSIPGFGRENVMS